MIKDIIRLIRPHQWVKNIFVLLPMFFAGNMLDTDVLVPSVITFAAFSLTASSIYCFNDIIDAESDRRHPVKCKRPVASGAISTGLAVGIMVAMAVMAAATLLMLDSVPTMNAGYIIAVYFCLNIAYCAKLKQYAIIDVCVIAMGFVLRVLAGGMATGIVTSHWLVLMTFLLTLFLSFAKRRDDVLRMNETGEAPRKNTIRYNLTFINQAITITSSVTMVCYIMYTVSPEVTGRFGSNLLYLTSVFVLIGLLRYIQIAVVDEKSGDPTKVMLHDRFIQGVFAAWLLSFIILIYL